MYLSKRFGKDTPKPNKYPWWSPRFWHGMRFGDWVRLAHRHRYRVHPMRWSLAFTVSTITPFNSVMRQVQRLLYSKAIAETEIEEPPVFIVGHWRSGTTLLHEMLVRDDRFAFPTTFQCFAPHHFLITEWFFSRYCWFLLPKQRPMDNMAAGFTRPQEDEFALMNLGAPTPYLRLAFVNDEPPHQELLDMQDVPPDVLQAWQDALVGFMKGLTYKYQKRLLLKSPPHLGRVGVLAEMFPGAKFVHIVRDPMSVFPSTMRLWQSLDGVQSLQLPKHDELEEMVFSYLERMYAGYERQKQTLDPDQLCEVRYEDLVRDPRGQVRHIYESLDLGDFDSFRPQLDEFLESQRDYQTNPHQLDDELKERIIARWGEIFARYGYGEGETGNGERETGKVEQTEQTEQNPAE